MPGAGNEDRHKGFFHPEGQHHADELPGAPGPGGTREDLVFARLLAAVGIGILVMALVLVVLPYTLRAPALAYLIAYVVAALFGPVGFSLLAAAWRIHNRAVHGSESPPHQRRWSRGFGAALVVAGALLALGGLGSPSLLTRIVGLVWGVSLALYGGRFLLRSIVRDNA